MSHDQIGARMKENYEVRSQTHLPRRTHTIIRLDGKAFHSFTKGFTRPYDLDLMNLMDRTAAALCQNVQGCCMAYVQSDEISLVLTDFDTIQTDAWFDGNVQKITSVSASIATAYFNLYLREFMDSAPFDISAQGPEQNRKCYSKGVIKIALFDSRVFVIPDLTEVCNYMIWRQQDATRNSIQMGAQALYSQKQLDKKNTSELQEMMFQKGINWNDYPVGFKRGRMILKEKIETVEVKPVDIVQLPNVYVKDAVQNATLFITRKKWASFEPPIFSQDPAYLLTRIPKP